MKKLFLLALIAVIALVLAGCPADSDDDDNGENLTLTPDSTTLVIYNDSDFNILDVDYASVDFGTINRSGDAAREIEPGMRFIFFSVQTNHGIIQFRTAERLNCEEGKRNEFFFLNTTVITTMISGNSFAFRDHINTINNGPANSTIEVHHDNYPLTSGGTIDLGDIPAGNNRTMILKIINSGEHDLVITGTRPQISGTNAAQASVLEDYTSQRLAYEQTLEFSVRFNAVVNGDNSFIITIVSNDQENGNFVINVSARVLNTWERLYGAAGHRYGIYRAIDNGQGGLYAGGFSGSNSAVLFNFNEYGILQNHFTYNSSPDTLGPVGIGYEYNDYYSVYESSTDGNYFITKAASPTATPSTHSTSLNFAGDKLYMYPAGIEKRNNYYFVAGNAWFYPTTTAQDDVYGIFVNRHLNNGNWEMGTSLQIAVSGLSPAVRANTFEVRGMTILSNGDVLIYGNVETTAGYTNAFASAINVSNANSGSWAVRWTQTYANGTRNTGFYNHFYDTASPPNLILLGGSDGDGFVTRFPSNVTTATAARPAGWPKIISGNTGDFLGGLYVHDNSGDDSGYIFVGGASGPNGGTDVWVVKTDTNINDKIWERFFGGSGDDYSDAIIEVNDGFIIAGSTTSPTIAGQTRQGPEDIYILKINKDGTLD